MATKVESSEAKLDAPKASEPKIVTYKIVGVSPLLQNNPAEFIGADEDQGLQAGKKKYNDEEEAALRIYRDSEGNLCHPCEAFVKSMIRAVTGRTFGKKAATTVLKGTVFIVEPHSLLLDDKGKSLKKWEIDRRSVVIGKARVLRCRPMFPKWRVNLSLEVDTALMNPDDVKDALSLAGRIVGIGDYRPEKGGGFGRFKVE